MDSFNLSGIPIRDRELMEINQNQVKQILGEIDRLQNIIKTDPASAAKAKKRLNNATRALADVIETPELFADYTPTKGIKYIGEGYYGKGKSFLESMQLDPTGMTGSKSTLHHNDSLKQLFNAIYHPDPNIRYKVLQGIRESKGRDIGSTLSNLSDADFGGHQIYHADPITGKADWKNKGATVAPLPLDATVEDRIAAGIESTKTQGLITETAEKSDVVATRQLSMTEDILKTPGGTEVLDAYGNPFNLDTRSEEGIKAVQNLDVQYKPVLNFDKGNLKLSRKQMTLLAGAGVGAISMLGTASSAAETVGRTQIAQETGNPLDYLQAGISGTSLAADLVPHPAAEIVSTPADLLNIAVDTVRNPEPIVNAYEKIKEDPLNELEYVGKQALSGLKTVGGAILFGFGL